MSVGPHSEFGPLADSTLRGADARSEDQVFGAERVIWNQMFLSHQSLKSLNQEKTVVSPLPPGVSPDLQPEPATEPPSALVPFLQRYADVSNRKPSVS